MVIISILAFVFVVGILVILHEAGHFLVARLLGAPVEVFSVGFGKRLWGFEWHGTDYRLSAVPIGGYVRIIGLGPDESDLVSGGSNEAPLLPRWKRGLILLAGSVTNLVTAVAFLAVAFVIGVQVPAYQDQPAVVGWVEPSSPADAAGVKPGDRILTVDGTLMKTWRDLEMLLLTSGGSQVTVVLERDGTTHEVRFTPEKVTQYQFGYSGILPPVDATVHRLLPGTPAAEVGLEPGDRIVAVNGNPVEQFYDLINLIAPHPDEPVTLKVARGPQTLELEVTPTNQSGEGKIGLPLVFSTGLRRLGVGAALRAGLDESRRITSLTFRIIGRLLTRRASIRQVSGPLDIARISGEAAREGINSLVWLMGIISLQLGIFNLLPIPLLDGGHLAILGFEATIRRDLPIRAKERILEIGFYLLMVLMVIVLFNDIRKLIPGLNRLLGG